MIRGFVLFLTAFLLLSVSELYAQTKVTFNVNLKPLLEDSTFVPSRGDRVEVTGNVYPLGSTRTIVLKDEEPVDSVFTAEVEFPRSATGKNVNYNYVIKTAEKTLTEGLPRTITLRGRDIKTDPLLFDSYAW